MKKVIIGSTALKHYYPDFKRVPKDLDYAVDTEIKSNDKNIEYLYNPIIFKYLPVNYLEYCNPFILLNLKISHLFWDINWEKHMWDVQFLLNKGEYILPVVVSDFRDFWSKYLPKIHRSDLRATKDDFFTNAVNKSVNEHDLLHEKLVDYPTYKKILKEGCDVELDESKWNYLSFDEKCNVVYEETSVMAFERYNPELYWKKAFNRQLKDNIIKHFPQYIALFAIENYIKLSNPQLNYQIKLCN